ncbi:MAG: helix-turn-helix transcriptional regulator [Bacteroidia bacterium]|nr:helix-turn-helix transcriptional regulator [Bacteroidia bacterium]
MESGVVRYVDHSMNISKQIVLILRELDVPNSYLASKLGKKESEISKWLRGTHNFTLKTISKIEDILGQSIIVCPKDVSIPKNYWISPSNSIIPIKSAPDQVSKNMILSTDIENEFCLQDEALSMN